MKLTGSMLIYPQAAMLNCNEPDVNNTVCVKRFGSRNYAYVYVSAPAWRRWWKDTLASKLGWNLSPVTVIKDNGNKAHGYSAGDPIAYPDDDLFGYMRAINKQTTTKRIAPFRHSVILALHPVEVPKEFGALRSPDTMESAIYNREVYTAWMSGRFTLELDRVGRFEFGVGKEYLPDALLQRLDGDVSVFWRKHDEVEISQDKKARRVADVLKALPQLEGGAHLTRQLTNVHPRALLLAFTNIGNCLLEHAFSASRNEVSLNIDYLRYLFASEWLDKVYYAAEPGVVQNEQQILNELGDKLVRFDTVSALVESVCEQVESYYSKQQPVRYGELETLKQHLQELVSSGSTEGKKGKRGKKSEETAELDLDGGDEE